MLIRNRVPQQQAGERRTGELAGLVGIEDLRSTVSGERLQAALRPIYAVPSAEPALTALDAFDVAPGNRNKTAPCFATAWRVLSPVKLGVLAMLALERGCAWLRSCRYAARPPRKCQVGTKQQPP
jgi:hypothetical protein